MPILIGLAIDYGVHLISRYEEELRRGQTREAALTKALVYTGQGIFTGAFTTAGAFLAMYFTDFKGIQEMGVICGGGLLICLIPMITMLPVLLLRGHQNTADDEAASVLEKRQRIENIWLQRPGWVLAITLALCALAGTQIGKVHFDYNLLNMQSEGLPAVEFEKDLISATNTAPNETNAAPKSVLYGAVIATNLAQAVEYERLLTNLPAVSGVDSMTKYLAEDPTRKLEIIRGVKKELCSVNFSEPDTNPVDIPDLSSTLYRTYGYLGAALDDIGTNDPALSQQLVSLRTAIEGLR